jgi:hypothetical protein
MKRWLKEPLLHFLLLGAAVFAVFHWMSGATGAEQRKIVITQSQIENLATTFARAWRRPPTAGELDGLIRDYIREEVAVREAVALGLDRDDTVIRRRLRQKLDFVSEALAALTEPTEAELYAYLEQHADAFRTEPRFTFSQVYLNPQRRGADLAHNAAQLLAVLDHAGDNVDMSALGDPFLLGHTFNALSGSDIARLFGDEFAARLGELAPGRWQGPIDSGYGAHLVLISDRTLGRSPELAEVRDAVRREWANARRVEAQEKLYQALLHRYTVTVEQPPSAEEEKRSAETSR